MYGSCSTPRSSQGDNLLPEPELLLGLAAVTNACIPCPIIANRVNKMMATVTATLIPDVKRLVQITGKSTTITINHKASAPPSVFPSALNHLVTLSRLNETSTRGMEMAAEIETGEKSANVMRRKVTHSPTGDQWILTHVFEHITHGKLSIVVKGKCIHINGKECCHKRQRQLFSSVNVTEFVAVYARI